MRPFDSLTLMQFLWAALSIFGFAIRTNLKGFSILLTALGGGLSWAFYLISLYYTKSPLLSVLISTILVCSYSQIQDAGLGICDLRDHTTGARKRALLHDAGISGSKYDRSFLQDVADLDDRRHNLHRNRHSLFGHQSYPPGNE